MNMTRRGFLKVSLVAAAATAVPITLTKALERRIPVIHGDGVHDDTDGLNAAFSGREFVCADDLVTVSGSHVFFRGGVFRLTNTLHLKTEVNVEGNGATFLADRDFPENMPMLQFPHKSNSMISDCTLVGNYSCTAASYPADDETFVLSWNT